MPKELTESEVARVVAEVTRQSQLRDVADRQVLERSQVLQILEELKLPADLLDPAMRELERRDVEAAAQARRDEALRKQRRRHFLIAGSVLAFVLVVVLIFGTFMRQRSQALAQVVAAEPGRITRAADDGGNLTTVRRAGDEIYYRVTLERVPISENLSMKCNWIDPNGRTVKTNSWQTKSTDKSVWATSCRNLVGTATQPGNWRVEMLLDDRVISKTEFHVE